LRTANGPTNPASELGAGMIVENRKGFVEHTEAQDFANQSCIPYFETSAKLGLNVAEMFETLAEYIKTQLEA
jgi:hypothetical protein